VSLVRLIAKTRLTNHGGGLLDANGVPTAVILSGEVFQVDGDNAVRLLRRNQATKAEPLKKSSKKSTGKG
tara:strand:+ start:85 stop:294 length:210 start_codon:yes stop_codon:yes gene_type:complete